MKFILATLFAIASVNAIAIKTEKPDNWTEDWGYKFDEKHFDDNKHNSKFTDSIVTKPRGDNSNCSTC